jgi:hypothetical protein
MRLWIKILLMMVVIYAAGVVTGFFVSPSYQNQTKLIGQVATVIQYPAILGVVIAMWKTITDWYRENVLEYDGLFVKQQPYSWKGKDINYPAYYLRIRRTRGRGRAENCDGFVTIEETEINRNSMWEGGLQYIPISIQGDLKLFEIHENDGHKDLVFRSNPANSLEHIWHDALPYTDELGKRIISVRIGSSNASVPSQPFIKTVRQIIESAQQE